MIEVARDRERERERQVSGVGWCVAIKEKV
jgi:hypothetical protein